MTDYLSRDGWDMAYDDSGGSGQVLMLCHALGADRTMWDGLLEHLDGDRRIIRYDNRGHGESDAPPAPYTMSALADDVIALADHVGADRFDYCGISIGGQIGLWLAINEGRRVDRLVLANTGSKIGTEAGWDERIANVRAGGMEAIAQPVVERLLSQPWREAHPEDTESALETMRAIDPEGYIGCCMAVRDSDFTADIASINAPTFLFGGRHDVSTPPASQELLAESIPDSELMILDAAHLSPVEQSGKFATALGRFLESG